jgi:hypothetical protein
MHMGTCVNVVSSTVREDHNPHISCKDLKVDKTDMWWSMISSFESVVAVYVGLSCVLSKPNSIFKQLM